ncbi:ras-like protein family member 10B isoform X2 [Ooceraea biroi]|uniref:ras-like protein family member 10B isoform X2 n=1 Tax=Ooceraea biroi TaxID=2015173 RepID=UPI0005B9DF25|nr:ras-like protein family member 10B isoform X2 [Ooceraea biroi]
MDHSLKDNETSTSSSILHANKRLLELDLDFLERRGGNTIIYEGAESGSKEEDSPADTLDRVKVVFLGAPGVGKTSIIRQFVWSEFSEEYRPTERRETFYPSVVLADRLYELKITDLPTLPYFPVSSHLEWTDFRYCGLRSATAYVLVFDLSNQDTFQDWNVCSVHQDIARTNLRGARHEGCTVAGGWEQARRIVAGRRLRNQISGHRKPCSETLEMRLR